MSARSAITEGTAPVIRRMVASLVALAVVLMLACVAVVSQAALDAFEHEVRPALEQEATALGGVVAGPIELALDLGVPFDELAGVEAYFDTVLAGRGNIAYLVLAAPDGRPAFRAGPAAASFEPMRRPGEAAAGVLLRREVAVGYDTALRLGPPGEPARAWLHIGISRGPLETAVTDTRWDVLIVLLVGIILVIEFLRFVVDRTVTTPLAAVEVAARRLAAGDFTVQADHAAPDEAGRLGRAANALVRRLNDRWARLEWLAGEVSASSAAAARDAAGALSRVAARLTFRRDGAAPVQAEVSPAAARLPLFLFVFAEQLSTSFIPLRGLDLAQLGPGGADPTFLAAVPIAAFVAAVALATPHGGRLAAGRGTRFTILVGGAIAMAGFAWAAVAESLVQFTLARSLCGVGYALVSIACQAQMALAAPRGRLASSLGGFTGAVMTGAVCGTAIGAVLADRIGYGGTFLASVLLVGVVQLVALRTFPAASPEARSVPQTSLLEDARIAFRAPAFVALLLFAAIPAKIVLTGFVFYLAPLALSDAGLSQSAIGRTVMLYGFCMLPAIVLGGWLADRVRLGGALIWVAAIVTGLAMLLPLAMPLATVLPIAIAATGIAQGLAAGPMLAAATQPDDGARTPVRLAFLRLGERVGSVIGPFAAAWLLVGAGMASAVALIGVVSVVTGLGYAVALLLRRGARVPVEGRA